MFILKKKYFLIIESIKDIDLTIIKKHHKFVIIYRNHNNQESVLELTKFCKECKLKNIKFFIANNLKLATCVKSDGVYLSAKNREFRPLSLKKKNFKIIGSAHNYKELEMKSKQGCEYILFSRLFKVSYKPNKDFLGVNRFNKYCKIRNQKIIPLGGINILNLRKLQNVNSEGFAIMSEIKKKPTKIFSRLF